MEKAVKGATKIKLAAPKSKYVETILSAANGGEAGVAEVFRTLQLRLRDSTWTIVFKSLIMVHLMIREGQSDVTLRYIADSPKRLAISNFTDVQTQGANIRRYSDYLLEKAKGYRDTKVDFVRSGSGRLKRLSIDKGLLRETEIVQEQIRVLLKCDMLGNNDPDNEITLTAFRLLTMDLLELFKVMNEGTISVLEHYFELSKPDAERALNIYKAFGRQTDQVVQYLTVARQYQSLTKLQVPRLKHAPTTLATSLQEYLNDPDFEINRRQYLAQTQGGKGASKPISKSENTTTPFDKVKKSDPTFPAQAKSQASAPTEAKGPAPDLIDFFDSIEQNQQPMAQPNVPPQPFANGYPQAQQYQQLAFVPQQTGYNPFLQNQQQDNSYASSMPVPQQQPQLQQQQTNPYAPSMSQPQQPQLPLQPLQQSQLLQPDFTGAGFGGYTQQPQQPQSQQPTQYPFQTTLSSIPQNGVASFDQQQQQQYQLGAQQVQPQQSSSNPFRQSTMPTGISSTSAISSPASNRQSTNPFAKTSNPPPSTQLFQSSSSSPLFANSNSPFTSPPPQTQQQELQQTSPFFSAGPPTQTPSTTLAPQKTGGTNPFARNKSPQPQAQQAPASSLTVQPTGSTNPFRQSHFVNQQTGLGWQNVVGSQGTFGGFDVNHVDTVPVFPRPGAN